jgi:predicted dehydrogenase
MIKRVLIVGKGSIGKRHFEHLSKLLPDAEIKFLRHLQIHPNHIHDETDLYSIQEAFEFSPELSVICNPSSKHIETALLFAGLGSHLFIEKPISNHLHDVQKLIDLCEVNNLVLAVGYNLRFLNSLSEFKNVVNSCSIGKLISVRVDSGSYLPDWRYGTNYRESASAIKDLGGGALLELSHEIDYLRWIFGELGWVRATLVSTQSLEIDVEDVVHLIFGFKQNSDELSVTGQMNLDFARREKKRTCLAIGTLGSLEWDGITGEVRLFDPKLESWVTIFSAGNSLDQSYEGQWRNVLNCIESGSEPEVTGIDGISVMKIIESIRISSNMGIQVQID